jgi:short-subunit dehydrogenase
MKGTVLITGASAGLGAEFARQLDGCADRLILVARRGEKLQSLAATLSIPSLLLSRILV